MRVAQSLVRGVLFGAFVDRLLIRLVEREIKSRREKFLQSRVKENFLSSFSMIQGHPTSDLGKYLFGGRWATIFESMILDIFRKGDEESEEYVEISKPG